MGKNIVVSSTLYHRASANMGLKLRKAEPETLQVIAQDHMREEANNTTHYACSTDDHSLLFHLLFYVQNVGGSHDPGSGDL